MAQYRSPMSVGHRKHIYLSEDDPRAKREQELENYRSKSGAKIIMVASDSAKATGPINLEAWSGGWYLRTVQPLVNYFSSIASNETNIFMATDDITFLITTEKGYQIAGVLNYLDNVWHFSETPEKGIVAYAESAGNFIEAYYFLENYIVNTARFFPLDPYEHINSVGSNYGDLYIVMDDLLGTTFLKYTSVGDIEWEKTVDVVAGEISCIDSESRIYSCNTSANNIRVISVDSTGEFRWSKEITGIANTNGLVFDLIVSDGVYIVGNCGIISPDFDVFVIKLDLDGNIVWAKVYENDLECIASAASKSTSGFLLCGKMINSETDSDGFVMEVLQNGEILWTRKIKSDQMTMDKQDVLYGCTSDKNKNYVSGIIFTDGAEQPNPRAFAAAIKGAFPVGSYNIEGYHFTISEPNFTTFDITPTINTITSSIISTNKITIVAPDGIYAE